MRAALNGIHEDETPLTNPGADVFPFGFATAQNVVIEGGPDTVQISDCDGKPEPITSQRTPGPDAAIREEQSLPGGLLPPEVPAGAPPVGLRPAHGRVVGPAGIAAVRESAGAPQTLAVGEAKRIAELKRELGILDTGRRAALTLDMQNVFVAGAATIDAISVGQLKLIAEYLQITLAKEIRLTYHFAPNLHDEDLAWARAVAMVKWMTGDGGLAESSFTILNPEKVTEPTPAGGGGNGSLAAMRNRLEFSVTFR